MRVMRNHTEKPNRMNEVWNLFGTALVEFQLGGRTKFELKRYTREPITDFVNRPRPVVLIHGGGLLSPTGCATLNTK